MSVTNKLKRYELILNKVESSKYPALTEIYNYLQRFDINPSERTLQRDMEELKTDFNIELVYDKKQRGYYIEKNTSTDTIIQFIKNMSLQANLLEFSKISQESNAIILKEEYYLKGIEWIPVLLDAIQHQLSVELTYHKFYEPKPDRFNFHPYGLKEFQGRWYAVGLVKGETKITKFGVDRIVDIKLTDKKFKTNKDIDLVTYFSRMIGIIDDDGSREIVVLSFTPFQANYIRTLPLHWSQKEILTNDKEVQFEYYLLLNHELMQKILSYGAEVKVIKPAALQAKHKEWLKNALTRYKK
ncbi:MAG: WYL domain-containing protein [Sphingobacteriales bacterium]|nr:WYL domain-containing protein [Sphingobacteriales bacterium]